MRDDSAASSSETSKLLGKCKFCPFEGGVVQTTRVYNSIRRAYVEVSFSCSIGRECTTPEIAENAYKSNPRRTG